MLTKKNLLLAISIFLSLNLFCQNASIPGIDIIGKSYNIFGEYANANSLKSYRIFDFSKVPTYSDNNGFTLPNIITLENISDHKSKSIEGTSASEYIQKLSANAGLQVNAFVFKGSFDASFNQNNSGSSYNYFYSILDENYKWRISLETRDVDYLISILDPLFVKDIQTLSPADFFKRYGSHIVVKGYLGGRAEFSMKSNATEQTVQKDLKMQLDARYVNVKAQGNLNTNSSNFTQNSNTQTQTRIIGGNSEYANNIENPAMYQKWVEGIKTAPVLCDFDEESLMPIWNLILDKNKKQELIDFFYNEILIKYPLNETINKWFKYDEILDNEKIEKKFNVIFKQINIIKACDGNELIMEGEFYYNFFVNKIELKDITINREFPKKALNNSIIYLNYVYPFTLPPNQAIHIEGKIFETNNNSQDDLVGIINQIHTYPYSDENLYNFTNSKNEKMWEIKFISRQYICEANVYYQINNIININALNYEKEGRKAYDLKDYDLSLEKYKQALSIDNSLLNAHFNIALIYLIQNNPKSLNKYKYLIQITNDNQILKQALQDILEYEKRNGIFSNSNEIKMLLQAKIHN